MLKPTPVLFYFSAVHPDPLPEEVDKGLRSLHRISFFPVPVSIDPDIDYVTIDMDDSTGLKNKAEIIEWCKHVKIPYSLRTVTRIGGVVTVFEHHFIHYTSDVESILEALQHSVAVSDTKKEDGITTTNKTKILKWWSHLPKHVQNELMQEWRFVDTIEMDYSNKAQSVDDRFFKTIVDNGLINRYERYARILNWWRTLSVNRQQSICKETGLIHMGGNQDNMPLICVNRVDFLKYAFENNLVEKDEVRVWWKGLSDDHRRLIYRYCGGNTPMDLSGDPWHIPYLETTERASIGDVISWDELRYGDIELLCSSVRSELYFKPNHPGVQARYLGFE